MALFGHKGGPRELVITIYLYSTLYVVAFDVGVVIETKLGCPYLPTEYVLYIHTLTHPVALNSKGGVFVHLVNQG